MNAKRLLASLWRRRWVRRPAIGLGVFFFLTLAGATTFHAACNGPAQPQPAYEDPSVQAFEAAHPGYKRPEESTYLTIPEWYEVFSYQEYGHAIATGKPSTFPHFSAIHQFWSMYCDAYGRTSSTYPFNGGNHLMIGVIGVSYTVEYGIKGLYEQTVGRLTEWDSHTTQEDAYAATVAADYGKYVETEPWYRYAFGAKAFGLWTDTDLVGHHMVRKVERKLFLTVEYTIKSGYAFVIRTATGAIYGAPAEQDFLWVEHASHDTLNGTTGVRIVQDLGNESALITVPHYQGFTDALPTLAQKGVTFRDVSGNDEIVLTAQVPQGWRYDLPVGRELYRQPVIKDPASERLLIHSRVGDLAAVLEGLRTHGARIEHLFDY